MIVTVIILTIAAVAFVIQLTGDEQKEKNVLHGGAETTTETFSWSTTEKEREEAAAE